MKYSKKAEEITRAAGGSGIRQSLLDELFGECGKRVRQLEREGYVIREKNQHGPGFIVMTIKQITKPARPVTRPRQTPRLDTIIGVVARFQPEAPGSKVARALGVPHSEISGDLLKLCVLGRLCRRQTAGTIEGCTEKRRLYMYRLPDR